MTWWTDYQTRRGIDRKSLYINNMKNIISTEFKNSTSYNLVKINDVDRDVRIVEESSIIKNPNKKRLLCYPDETINIGDIVDFDGSKWICTETDTTSQVSNVGIITRCNNNTLNFYDQSHILHQIPCIIQSNINLDTDQTTYIESPSTTIILKIPNNEITRQIKRGEIYKIGLQSYEIKDINDIVEPGILKMEIEYSQEVQEEHLYTLKILNGNSVDIQESTTLQLNINVFDNETLISPTPSLTFTSSNTGICTVNSSGLVTALSNIGSCNITVKLTSDNTILDTITINVIEVPQDNITYELLGNADIIKNYSQNYIAKKYNNGILVENAEFTFSIIPGNTPVNAYVLNVIDSDQCSITANLTTYYIVLRAVDNSNGEFVEKSIKLFNLF